MTEKSILKKKGKNVPQKIIFCDKNLVAIHLDIVDLLRISLKESLHVQIKL